MVYKNKGVSQVYYGDKRIREIWLGNKRIFGSPFVHVYDDLWSDVNTGEWLLAGGILYRKDKGKDNWHISARGVSDIIETHTSAIAALKDGNLHFSAGTSSNRYLANAVDSGWSRVWEMLDANGYTVAVGCDCFGILKACLQYGEHIELVFPEVRFKKQGITANDEWVKLEGSINNALTEATVSLRPRRRDVIDFYVNTYLNKHGEVRIYKSGAGYEENLSQERIVTTLSGTDIKFFSDTEFLHDGFIYTIGTDSFSKSDVGGFTDIGSINSEPCGIRDGVICKLDGSVLEGSPENVTDLYSYFALTSDYKVYSLSGGSAVLYLDLKEVQDA